MNGDVTEFDEQLVMDFNGVIVFKCSSASKYSIVFNSGILVRIDKADEEILQMMLLVPPRFKGAMRIKILLIFFQIILAGVLSMEQPNT